MSNTSNSKLMAALSKMGFAPEPIPAPTASGNVSKSTTRVPPRIPALKPAPAPFLVHRSVSAPESKISETLRPPPLRSGVSSPDTLHRKQSSSGVVEEPPPVSVRLPVYSYRASASPIPTVHFTRDEAEADRLVRMLDTTRHVMIPISVDFEWVVSIGRGMSARPISVVQLADRHRILIIQLRWSANGSYGTMSRVPESLCRLLENENVPKMGANILNDARKLFRDYGIMMYPCIELGALARAVDSQCKIAGNRKIIALAKLTEAYLQKTLAKDSSTRMGDWENPKLHERKEMLEYAANDAYCTMEIYSAMASIAQTNKVEIPTFSEGIRHVPLVYSQMELTRTDLPSVSLTPRMSDAGMLPQHLRAYRHWKAGWALDDICAELVIDKGAMARLKRSTVISYVLSAVKAWPPLPTDHSLLRELVLADIGGWGRWGEMVCQRANVDRM
ncbi:unnamed protein product [Mycena citricolor]|uniref:3'-5' exonuclease domain-containing protein n=1 Tax=Mycena citricolor TaxID=2018698 RepID=A0AAD2H378_9AGAR|nr:unnamed protein product [Mycena citricolor]